MTDKWQQRRLGDVTTKIGSGATPLGGEVAYKTDGISLIRSLNVHDGGFRTKDLAFIDETQAARLDNVIVKNGDVLLNITGASVARCCVVPSELLPARVNQHVSIIRSVADSVLPQFLHYLLTSPDYKNRLLSVGEEGGSTRQAITKAELQQFVIAFPSLAEQKRIVSILDEAFDGISTVKANAAKNIQNASALFESLLDSIFAQSDEGWVKMPLGEATNGVFTGPFGSLLHKSDYVENGIPLVNPAHITETGIEPDFQKTVSPETAQNLSNYIMHKGDVVIGRRGEMGRCALVTEIEDGWLCGTGSFFIRPSSRVNMGYLVRFLRSSRCKRSLEKIAGGAVMPNLSNSALGNFFVNLPPIDRQEAIVKEIEKLASEAQRLESIYQRKLDALEALKNSLLHQAFSGQL